MVKYFKSQWFSLAVGILNLGISIWNYCQDNEWAAVGWLLSAAVWLIMTRVNYNDERISMLEAKAKKYDAMNDKFDAMQKYIETLEKACGYKNGYKSDCGYKFKEDLK